MPQALQAKQKILVVAEEDLFWNGMKNKTKEYFRFGAKKMLASKLQGVRGDESVAPKGHVWGERRREEGTMVR